MLPTLIGAVKMPERRENPNKHTELQSHPR